MDEPRPPIVVPDHLRFALEPYDVPVPRDDPVRRSQWLYGQKHLGRFYAPALLIVRMNVLVPADRVLQPLVGRKPKRILDLRTYVGFTAALVEIGHEDNGRDLIQQCAI